MPSIDFHSFFEPNGRAVYHHGANDEHGKIMNIAPSKQSPLTTRVNPKYVIFSREYRTWTTMKSRCSDPNATDFAIYGGRGISVCERWMKFDNFFSDMGQRPSGMSLDRINSNGNYEPGNCKWSNAREQALNKRNNRLITMWGFTFPSAKWASMYGLPTTTVHLRMKNGWCAERAITTPHRKISSPMKRRAENLPTQEQKQQKQDEIGS